MHQFPNHAPPCPWVPRGTTANVNTKLVLDELEFVFYFACVRKPLAVLTAGHRERNVSKERTPPGKKFMNHCYNNSKLWIFLVNGEQSSCYLYI